MKDYLESISLLLIAGGSAILILSPIAERLFPWRPRTAARETNAKAAPAQVAESCPAEPNDATRKDRFPG